jgi:DNA-binding response OmpR family regulator
MDILVVEPSGELRERLVRIAREVRGVCVAEADTAERALALMRERNFELVLVDVDGVGAAALAPMRPLRWGRHGAVVALSWAPPPELVERCQEMGASFLLDLSREWPRVREVLLALGREPPGRCGEP